MMNNTYYDRIDMHLAKACDMVVSDLREQTSPGQLQEIFQNLLRNLPSNQISILNKKELTMNLFKSAYDDHMKRGNILRKPDTRTWIEKVSESIKSAKETFNGNHV